MTAVPLTLARTVADRSVIVCCGTGGVGKTTIAAALGLHAAQIGRRAVVVTIDPAKRLADALGFGSKAGVHLTNEPAPIMLDAAGELWAMMLDTATTFDGLVRANAASAEQAERILANGFYRNIAGSLSGTQEYMAAERLHALHLDDRFDVVIVDTPPTRNALDFLDAPTTLTRFIDHPLFKLMMLPTRRGLKVLNVAAQPVLRTIGKVVGGDVLADAIAFFQAFDGMETGFRERADEVLALLRSANTAFVLVASPRTDTIDEARYFVERLRVSSLGVAALVINRATPRFGASPVPERTLRRGAQQDRFDLLVANHAQLAAMAEAESVSVQPLVADIDGDVTWVPMMSADVHDLDGLQQIRKMLFDGDSGNV